MRRRRKYRKAAARRIIGAGEATPLQPSRQTTNLGSAQRYGRQHARELRRVGTSRRETASRVIISYRELPGGVIHVEPHQQC